MWKQLPTTDGMLFGIPFDKGQVLSESLTKPSVLGRVRFPQLLVTTLICATSLTSVTSVSSVSGVDWASSANGTSSVGSLSRASIGTMKQVVRIVQKVVRVHWVE